jgi:predicted unusual protein kinase regulating ubiquinone biosynthesis (AarF/ABC1/UbiB family)
MSEQLGLRAMVDNIRQEMPFWSNTMPQLPRLLHSYLSRESASEDMHSELAFLRGKIGRINAWLTWICAFLAVATVILLIILLR